MFCRLLLPIVVVSLVAPFHLTASAAPVVLDKPVRVSVQKPDKTKLIGRVVSHDEEGFELTNAKGESQSVKWAELDDLNFFAVRSALLTKGTGEDWLELGRQMRARGGEKLAERAFQRALRLDRKLKEQVQSARTEEPEKLKLDKTGDPDEMENEVKNGDEETTDVDGDGDGGDLAGADGGEGAGGPQMVGEATERTWKKLSDEEQAAAVKELDEFAEETRKTMGIPLSRHETSFFLFYTDLNAKEAKEWVVLLDRMYGRLANLFGIEKGSNIWRGKALVFVFNTASDYRRFQIEMHQTDPGQSAGMCHSFANGFVHIAFFRQQDRMQFAHVLVHESVHGFIHRFKGPANVPSWANEGLSEVIAGELVPRPNRAKQTELNAQRGLKLYGGLGGIFEAQQISGWQYPVAESLCAFMIRANKRGYVNFIIGIKEGLSWEESLTKKYKATRQRLVWAFGNSLRIKDLKE